MSQKYKDIFLKKMAKELGVSTKKAIKDYRKIRKLGLLPNQMREARQAEGAAILYTPKQQEGGIES